MSYKTRGNGGPDLRGNSKDRKRRKEWMLGEFGDGATCECAFPDCTEVLTYDTVTADRYPLSGKEGGRYIRGNIRPACIACNAADGQRIKELPYVPEVFESGPQW